ncbi:amino acid ABC transporter substrate-binding protein [Paradevosia shaoguanensis]|jgi:glutamate/aspartate transport system substrate-binding protein|uniref:amino acid ABC transporter substrate-binding protein n=1 Tax=Paradevosia shaoguanensis TaxID=1335043 RepID=UPI000455BE59|nr:amino acid ABC transporter substrate-binding protein [Paradevosia shaoguanensis]KFL28801.1 ABC transporter [Devosia sp. 17-2-E-8]QMV00923.1 transporter substrate-binding domain-containing protein [Devosia sp. D6-9]CDP52469.1 Glutamate Aspartate periplasmic binding protein pr ecursor GltI [Devosia sp. DBB001]
MLKKVIAVSAATLMIAAPAAAQDLTGTLAKIKETGTIALGHRDSSLPFSYYDDKQQVVGYAIDLCLNIADAVKKHLGMDELKIEMVPETPATRIPLLANGTIDLECGSTTNNEERQTQVGFTMTHYVVSPRYVSKAVNNLKTLEDLKGKTIVSTAGTTPLKLITELNAEQNLGINILSAKDHAEAFLMVETDRAVAFFMDDILLYSLAANSKDPSAYVITEEAYGIEPYGIMLRRDDPDFKAVVDAAMTEYYTSGAIKATYDKWFLQPIPPRDVNLNVPMSAAFAAVVAKPTDSPNPDDYR